MRLGKGDKLVVFLVFLLAVGGLFVSRVLSPEYAGSFLLIRTLGDGQSQRIPLADTTLDILGPLGITKVEVTQEAARISQSPCPDQICVEVFGWISQEGALSVCLPNQVMLQIEEDN